MSHFYGTLQGGRGQVTHCGTKAGGLVTEAASWDGAVRVALWHDDATDTDMVRVAFVPWRGVGTTYVLYEGPLTDAPRRAALAPFVATA
jgi:hypothetical protein